ncbi:MAG: hypothetical protein KJ069_29200 [Anaerolineae bacterium]|nr:hypothetical protein [Anaerolineae bacterium]
MTEQLTTFVEMMAHLDLDAYMPLPEPHRRTFRKLKNLRAQAAARDNQPLINELQPESQPNELIRVYAASMIVADRVDLIQLEVLGRCLQADKSTPVCIALAKK